jgi:predicted RND superfamily exporter protein
MREKCVAMKLPTKFVDSLIRFRWLFAVAALLAAIVAHPLAGQVSFDRSIENMFSIDDPLLTNYQRLQRTFGGNEIVLAVYSDSQLFATDRSGLARLSRISKRCERVPGVRAVLSVDRPLALLEVESPLADRICRLFANYTHSADGRTAAVVCMLEPEQTTTVPRRETVDQLRDVISNLPEGLDPGVLAGEPVMILDGFRYLERDGQRLGYWSTGLLALTIVICFRSLRWVVIPVAVVQWTLLVTRAVLVGSGLRLSMVSSMLTAIVTVVGVATVVHIIIRFREGRLLGLDSRAALRRAGLLLSGPILWACATDAVGFLSLTTARVGPIQDFGVMMAVGSLLVLPAVVLLVPALGLFRVSETSHATWGESLLGRLLDRCLAIVQAHVLLVCALTLLVTCLAIAGISRLEVETDFSKNFRADSPVVTSYQFVEDRLGGAGVLDIMLSAPPKLDWRYLERVSRLEDRLREELTTNTLVETARLTKVMSMVDAIDSSSPIKLEKSPAFARNGIITAAIRLMRGQMPVFMAALHGADPLAEDRSYYRIMLRAYERQPADSKLRLIERVEAICDEEFPSSSQNEGPVVTGFYVLLANLVTSVLHDQWTTFGLALAGIGIMLCLAFRSPLYAAVAVIPNALPIVLVLGTLGWTGGRVNMGVAMIAAVSLGLSVDGAIHYVTFFRRAREAGKSFSESISEVQRTVGLAVVFSTLALVVGFSVLCTSEFVPTVYFGLLVSLSMFGGLLGNLVLLPILLSAVCRWREG